MINILALHEILKILDFEKKHIIKGIRVSF
jgi:hypothetical protein